MLANFVSLVGSGVISTGMYIKDLGSVAFTRGIGLHC